MYVHINSLDESGDNGTNDIGKRDAAAVLDTFLGTSQVCASI